MAEIGVGARPATAPPGWYPDPSGRARLRWWSGTRWEWWVSDGVGRMLDPAAPVDQRPPLTRQIPAAQLAPAELQAPVDQPPSGQVTAPAPVTVPRQRGLVATWFERPGQFSVPLALTAGVLGPLAIAVAFAGLYVMLSWDGSVGMAGAALFVGAGFASVIGVAGLAAVGVGASRSCLPRERVWSTLACTAVNVAGAACALGWWFHWPTWTEMPAGDLPVYLYLFGAAALFASAPWCWLWFATLKGRRWQVRWGGAAAPAVAFLAATWVWALV